MRRYLAHTGSTVYVRPLCGAKSPYRAYRAFCLNPAADEHSRELRAMKCCGRQRHNHMVGWAADGRTHGEIAQ
eukprot:6730042-Prymnesium_polylepis.1